MAILQQNADFTQQFIGWYGATESSCTSFPLLTGSFNPGIGDFSLRHAVFPESDADINMATMQVPKSTFFKEIREVRADANAFKTYSGVQEVIFNIANSGVQELKCGRSYWIILQKGTDALDLPEFNFANEGTNIIKKLVNNL